MSKADQLGRGNAFGRAATARSSRRDAFDNALKGDTADTAAITDLPVTRISENPDNPRNHLRHLDETVESVREVGIILPIVVATTDAYLRDRPDRADDLEDGAQYVVVDGHRRLEAARRVGLATIPVRVDDARVSTDESLLEAAFIANYHRDDMTDLEEAHALQQLVEYYGSQTKAAKRLGIPQATISTKLSLLKLTPELQKDLVTGARKVEHVRNLGKLSPEMQKAKADERAETARQKSDQPTPRADGKSAEPSNYHAVIIPEMPPADAERPATPPPTKATEPTPTAPGTPEAIPEPRTEPRNAESDIREEQQVRKLPYDQPGAVAMILDRKMENNDVFFDLLRCLSMKAMERDPSRLGELARSLVEQVAPQAN